MFLPLKFDTSIESTLNQSGAGKHCLLNVFSKTRICHNEHLFSENVTHSKCFPLNSHDKHN